MNPFEWDQPRLQRQQVWTGTTVLHRGDRVRLRPGRSADILDLALRGKVAVIEAIEEDYEGRIYLSVTVEDDPGRDLGIEGQSGHRFFFGPDEVELLVPGDGGAP
jgi:hypothetical protein